MYEVLLRELEKENADFIKSGFVDYFDGDKVVIEEKQCSVNAFTALEALADFFETDFSNNKPMKSTVWDALYKKELFFDGDRLAVQFPIGKINEDTYVFPELIFRAKKILHISEAFYYYRKRENSIVHSSINLREISSCDLWDHIGSVISAYTNEYSALCIRNSLIRKLNILKHIYFSEYRKDYFNVFRTNLLANEGKYRKYITNRRLLITLKLIRCYPIYLNVKKLIGGRIY